MAHLTGKLTKRGVETAKAGRHGDGSGLYLVVDPSGARRWVLRVTVKRKRRDLGLGGASYVSLQEAREKAQDYRRIAKQGGDHCLMRKRKSRLSQKWQIRFTRNACRRGRTQNTATSG